MGNCEADNVHLKHDKQTCAAVLIYLEHNENQTVYTVRYPDIENRDDKSVDLLAECGTRSLVLEHTLVQSYPNQVWDGEKFVDLLYPLEEEPPAGLPDGDFTLSCGICAVLGVKEGSQIRSLVADWVKQEAPLLPTEPPGNSVEGQPEGVHFVLRLMRRKGEGRRLRVLRSIDFDDVPGLLTECLNIALNEKLPKLLSSATENDAKSIFIMESSDNVKDAQLLASALSSVPNPPDRMPDFTFIIDTHCGKEWFVYPVVQTDSVFVAGKYIEVKETEAEEYLRRRSLKPQR